MTIGTKQWHEKFGQTLINNVFSFVEVDKCDYTKHENYGCVVISLYVDDILIFGSSIQIVHETKAFLASKFEMKDMGEANFILGIKIIRRDDGIMLSQQHYVEKLLKKFDYFEQKLVTTPYD